MNPQGSITDVEGIEVGHWTDREGATGCTVVLCRGGAVAGVDVRGSAPGTYGTDVLEPTATVQRVHAVLLTGGSAFGLSAVDGVMRWLEERGIGFQVGSFRVPIVAGAVVFDLGVGQAGRRPGPEAGYLACQAAGPGPVEEGSVGAGAGATVAKGLGLELAWKGGVGTAARRLPDGVVVGALVVVNAVGNIIDPATGEVVAAPRDPQTGEPVTDPARLLGRRLFPAQNTTIGVVATNVSLTKAEAKKLAQMAHDGLARTIWPVHTSYDGDTMFGLSTGGPRPDWAEVSLLGAVGAELVAAAVLRAVRLARPLGGIRSVAESSGA